MALARHVSVVQQVLAVRLCCPINQMLIYYFINLKLIQTYYETLECLPEAHVVVVYVN